MVRELASASQLRDPANRAKVEQALDLIARGKTFAATGDPQLSPFVNALLERGAVSAQQLRQQLLRQPKPDEIQQEKEDVRLGQPIIPKGRKILGQPIIPGGRGDLPEAGKFTLTIPEARGLRGDLPPSFKITGKREEIKTFAEEFNLRRTDIDTDRGLLETVSETLTTPTGVRKVFGFGADVTLRGGELLASGIEEVLVGADEFLGLEQVGFSRESPLFTAPSPISKKFAKEILTDIFIFSAFAPFINTATASRTSKVAKTTQAKVNISDKKKIDRLRLLRDVIKRSSNKQVVNFIIKQLKSFKKSGLTLEQQALRVRNLELFIREARGQVKIINGEVLPVIDINKFGKSIGTVREVIFKKPKVTVPVPEVVKLEKIGEVLSATATANRLTVKKEQEKNRRRIEQAQKPLGERLAEAGQVGRAFGLPSVFAGTGQFERTEAFGNRLAQETSQIQSQLRQTDLSKGQLFSLRQRLDSVQREILRSKNNQLITSRTNVDQLTRQLQRNKETQKMITRQLVATTSVQRSDQLSKQLQQTKTAQTTLTKQLSKTKTLQKNLTKQVKKLKQGRAKPFKPFKPKPFKPKLIIPFFKRKKKKVKVKEKVELKIKNFQVFVRKNKKDILFKSFKTESKAQKNLRKRLSNTLRASGFIFDKKSGVKVKPKLKVGFRLGKTDKLRLVEKRSKRLDSKRETSSIQEAKRLKKSFKPDGNSMSKKLKTKSGRKK